MLNINAEFHLPIKKQVLNQSYSILYCAEWKKSKSIGNIDIGQTVPMSEPVHGFLIDH